MIDFSLFKCRGTDARITEKCSWGGDRASHLAQNMFHIYFSRNVPFYITTYCFTRHQLLEVMFVCKTLRRTVKSYLATSETSQQSNS